MQENNPNNDIPSIMDGIENPLRADADESIQSALPPRKVSLFESLSKPENKKLKIMLVITAFVIACVLIFVAVQFFDDTAPVKKSSNSNIGGALPTGQVTPQMRKEIDTYNKDVLPEVRKENPMAQPIALENSNNTDSSNELLMNPEVICDEADTKCMREAGKIGAEDCAPQDLVCSKLKSESHPSNAKSKVKESIDPYAQKLSDPAYMKILAQQVDEASKFKSVETGFVSDAKVNKSESSDSKNKGAIIVDNDSTSIIKKASTEEEVKIQKAGDKLMGIADIALNSDIEGPVSLTVLGGEYSDSIMIGKSTRVDEYMRLELSTWVLPDGKECQIDAIALDRKTTYAAIQSRLDNHTLYRYGWWGLGTVLGAIGKAAEKNADKEVIITNGIAVESTKSDAAREAKMAVGDLGQDIGKIMQKRIDRPSTVYVDRHEEMGIFFMKSVLKSSCK